MSDEERWLPVVGFEGRYEVSSLGRLRSLGRAIGRRFGVAETTVSDIVNRKRWKHVA